jgi:hypothetical protein
MRAKTRSVNGIPEGPVIAILHTFSISSIFVVRQLRVLKVAECRPNFCGKERGSEVLWNARSPVICIDGQTIVVQFGVQYTDNLNEDRKGPEHAFATSPEEVGRYAHRP